MSKKIFWIASYPKSGNTWMRAIISSLFFSKDGNFSFEYLNFIPVYDILKNYEFVNKININDYNNLDHLNIVSKYWIKSQENINYKKDIAFFKTHSSNLAINGNFFTNNLNTAGLIYMIRDPKDIAISYSYHQEKSIDETIEMMTNNTIITEINKKEKLKLSILQSRWDVNFNSWNNLDVPKLIIKYENLLDQTSEIIEEIIAFFNHNFKTNMINYKERVKNIIKSTNFKVFQKHEEKYGFELGKKVFFRKGKKMQWKKDLTEAQKLKLINEFRDTMNKFGYL